jgi:hypothetical protein
MEMVEARHRHRRHPQNHSGHRRNNPEPAPKEQRANPTGVEIGLMVTGIAPTANLGLLHRRHLQTTGPYSAGRRHPRGHLVTRSRCLTRGEIRARLHARGHSRFELIGRAPIDHLDGAITVVRPSARDECETPAVPTAAERLHDRRTR